MLDNEGVVEDQLVHFYRKLGDQVEADIKKGKSVIVGGEFNETREEGGLMYKVMVNIGLVNYLKKRTGRVSPTTRPGKRMIDHIWFIPEFYGEVNRDGIVGQGEVFLSNHAGLFIDLWVRYIVKEENLEAKPKR